MATSSAIPGTSITWRRLAGFCGIFGVALFVVGAALQGNAPQVDTAAGEVRTWYADHGSSYLAGGFIASLGSLLGLVPFFAYLRGVLAEAEGGTAAWSWVTFVGAILFLIIGGVASSFLTGLATNPASLESDAVVLALQYLGWGMFLIAPLALTPFFLGMAMIVLSTKVLAAWIGWLSLTLAAAGVISSAALLDPAEPSVFAYLGYASTLGLGIVIVATSISWLRAKASTV